MLYSSIRELEEIHNLLIKMAQTSFKAVENALQSIAARDEKTVSDILNGDSAINEQMRELDRKVLRVLALDQPVAIDLRFLYGVARIVTDIERIGDSACFIARKTQIVADNTVVGYHPELQGLADITLSKMSNMVDMLSSMNKDIAWEICNSIMSPIELSRKVIDNVAERAFQQSWVDVSTIPCIAMAYMLGRICEHCMNAAECVIFIAEGVDVRALYQDRIKM